MDVDNQQLKQLLQATDIAFDALRRNPDSDELTIQYEQAKSALDQYIEMMKRYINQSTDNLSRDTFHS